MEHYRYIALDSRGKERKGTLAVSDQSEALQRLRDLGLHPVRIQPGDRDQSDANAPNSPKARAGLKRKNWLAADLRLPWTRDRVKPNTLLAFTRQLGTLVRAGLPLVRGLRVMERQEKAPVLKRVIRELCRSVEGGSTFSEALAQHPKVFNHLYVNMVRAGEIGGVLEIVLMRLAEFMDKALRIKRKVVSAMFYPVSVLTVAFVILGVLMAFVVPRFQQVFVELLGPGAQLPAFTRFVLGISQAVAHHALLTLAVLAGLFALLQVFIRTKAGRRLFDSLKLNLPVIGPVISKVAISRFSRTLGTLLSSGVPILQALTIVKETAGNVVVADAVADLHTSVKEGETMALPLAASGVFPPVVVSMVDVGEQTGALPEMLMTVANDYDDEVDNAVAAMTSLLEPIMIVLLALIVGSIVIALFLPLIDIFNNFPPGDQANL